MKYIIYILLFLLSLNLTAQKQVEKQVIGTGGGSVSSESKILQGTIGQSIVGITNSDNSQKNLGFWYSADKDFNDSLKSALVTLPTIEAEIGEEITIPLMLVNSRKLEGEPHKWEAEIKFNSTILYPIDKTPACGKDEECTINVSGEFSDSTGVLFNLDFITKLGAVENTDLEIISFRWVGENISTVKKNGFFQLKGVCIIDGEVRLIERTLEAGISNVYPNPAAQKFNINYQLREDGFTKLEIMDSKGQLVKQINGIETSSGTYILDDQAVDIPSGTYYLVLTTPNEIFTKRLVIEK